MTIKASSLLAIVAIWAMMIAAVLQTPEAWWALIFAGLATTSIGIGFWRRLGLAKLVAVVGIWAGTALIIANGEAVWPSVMAFLATAALVHARHDRNTVILGLAFAAVWLLTAYIVIDQHAGAAISVFAALTVGTLAGNRSRWARGLTVLVWWGAAGVVILATNDHYWLAAVAWLLSIAPLGIPNWNLPRRIEWDFGERDDRPMDRL